MSHLHYWPVRCNINQDVSKDPRLKTKARTMD